MAKDINDDPENWKIFHKLLADAINVENKDAERLDWCEQNPWRILAFDDGTYEISWTTKRGSERKIMAQTKSLREAIDQAMKDEPNEQ